MFYFCGTDKRKKSKSLCEELAIGIFAGWVNASQMLF